MGAGDVEGVKFIACRRVLEYSLVPSEHNKRFQSAESDADATSNRHTETPTAGSV